MDRPRSQAQPQLDRIKLGGQVPHSTDPWGTSPGTAVLCEEASCPKARTGSRAVRRFDQSASRQDAADAARPRQPGATLSTFGLPRAPAGRTSHAGTDPRLGVTGTGAPPRDPGSRAPGIPPAIEPDEAEQTCPSLSRSFSRRCSIWTGLGKPHSRWMGRRQTGRINGPPLC